jgi:competence protein ComEC
VLASPVESDSGTYVAFRDAIDRAGVPYREATAGARIDLGGGAVLEVLAPREASFAGDVNDASLVLRLTYGEASFLLTGDIEARGEELLLSSGAALESTVLKVAHHGSLTSTTPAFAQAVAPRVAVVSVGEDNRYGHPAPAVLERLGDAAVLRTDQHGTVRIKTDGERLWVYP